MHAFIETVKFVISTGTFLILIINYIQTREEHRRIADRREKLHGAIDGLYDYLVDMTSIDSKTGERILSVYETVEYPIEYPVGRIGNSFQYEKFGSFKAVDTDKLFNEIISKTQYIRAFRDEEVGTFLIKELETEAVSIKNPLTIINRNSDSEEYLTIDECYKVFPRIIGNQPISNMLKLLEPYLTEPKKNVFEYLVKR